MKSIRVMLVDDSMLFLNSLQMAIDREPDMRVVFKAMNGKQALAAVSTVHPDVILCDVQMPQMDGIEFLRRLLPQHKIPVLVISGTPGITLKALNSGALDFISKPTAEQQKSGFFARVVSMIRTAAAANLEANDAVRLQLQKPAQPMPHFSGGTDKTVVAIGASTGGTEAIVEVVRELPVDFPPVLVTQHMPAGFTTMYAQRLEKECQMRACEAIDGLRLRRGQLVLAAGGFHLRLASDSNGYYVTSKPGPKVNGHLPSVDVLFDSVAQTAGRHAVGVILTGMGGDGAEGLLHMRQQGAYTIGQDQQTCVVYGMPMMAYNNGAVVKQLPLDQIRTELMHRVSAGLLPKSK